MLASRRMGKGWMEATAVVERGQCYRVAHEAAIADVPDLRARRGSKATGR